MSAKIFLCGDTGQSDLLARAATALGAQGHRIVRGPLDTPGELRTYSATERSALLDDVDVAVFTVRHTCSRELMAEAKRLRGVCYPTIGVESLDLDAANDLGIIVGHGAVRGNVVGMAEATLMLMLMLLYDVETNIRRINAGLWRRPGHNGRQIEGKTIGLIGFGRIAREIAARLEPFGVRIVTYSPRTSDVPANVEKVELDALLELSDIVSVLTGLTPETRGMIDAARLARMKPSAYLINTGRGAIIDEAALETALRERRIAGAALDTFTVEPLPADSGLRELPDTILTPHCVGHTIEGWEELVEALVENVSRILQGALPLHCKNPQTEPAWRERLRRLDHMRADA